MPAASTPVFAVTRIAQGARERGAICKLNNASHTGSTRGFTTGKSSRGRIYRHEKCKSIQSTASDLLCSDVKCDAEKLRDMANLMRLVRIEFSVKNYAASNPFRKRLGTAMRLLAGKAAFRNRRY